MRLAPLLLVVFPAGILQPPFFDLQADDAANYGAIGAVIGHEIGHQFDDGGSKVDATGTLQDWWTEDDRKKFEARTACVVDQFNTLDVGGGQHHNGKQVLGEALGDFGRPFRCVQSLPAVPRRETGAARDGRIHRGPALLHCFCESVGTAVPTGGHAAPIEYK